MTPHQVADEEQRVDLESRTRIAELEARWRRTAHQLRIALGVFAVSAVVGYFVLRNVLDEVQAGRRAGLAVSCATTNAIIAAGRATITSSSVGPPVFVRHLERIGFPPVAKRKAASRAAAARYAKSITDTVAAASGDDAQAVVRPDGTLRCATLQHISRTR